MYFDLNKFYIFSLIIACFMLDYIPIKASLISRYYIDWDSIDSKKDVIAIPREDFDLMANVAFKHYQSINFFDSIIFPENYFDPNYPLFLTKEVWKNITKKHTFTEDHVQHVYNHITHNYESPSEEISGSKISFDESTTNENEYNYVSVDYITNWLLPYLKYWQEKRSHVLGGYLIYTDKFDNEGSSENIPSTVLLFLHAQRRNLDYTFKTQLKEQYEIPPIPFLYIPFKQKAMRILTIPTILLLYSVFKKPLYNIATYLIHSIKKPS